METELKGSEWFFEMFPPTSLRLDPVDPWISLALTAAFPLAVSLLVGWITALWMGWRAGSALGAGVFALTASLMGLPMWLIGVGLVVGTVILWWCVRDARQHESEGDLD